MQTSGNQPQRGKRYYYVVIPAILVVIALGIIFIDPAPWLLIFGGVLLGGFIVNVIVDWVRYRRSTSEEQRPLS
jgi:hypothetical protein